MKSTFMNTVAAMAIGSSNRLHSILTVAVLFWSAASPPAQARQIDYAFGVHLQGVQASGDPYVAFISPQNPSFWHWELVYQQQMLESQQELLAQVAQRLSDLEQSSQSSAVQRTEN